MSVGRFAIWAVLAVCWAAICIAVFAGDLYSFDVAAALAARVAAWGAVLVIVCTVLYGLGRWYLREAQRGYEQYLLRRGDNAGEENKPTKGALGWPFFGRNYSLEQLRKNRYLFEHYPPNKFRDLDLWWREQERRRWKELTKL